MGWPAQRAARSGERRPREREMMSCEDAGIDEPNRFRTNVRNILWCDSGNDRSNEVLYYALVWPFYEII